jgi:serine/threonine-protein kinase
MSRCPDCSGEIPAGSRFCPACGRPLETPTSAPTETSLEGGTGKTAGPADRTPVPDSRFLPGTVIAGRYRIVGLLGTGGMGEVYRADDLKLGQTVALKFLPEPVQQIEGQLDRFLNEVKLARLVAHPNVCRVFDIGEVDGLHYISMEYVDGEDLASLLRRIGRLPKDKALQIARQLCAGLAAAHGQGILHRDLKPANVMIDGRGRAKIADFGLASLAAGIRGDEAKAGTPAYMAPEQLAAKEATVRSDLYALGLVLYELFTGKRAYDASTATELRRLHEQSMPTSPSSYVDGMDPSVERVILRCLERNPLDRPRSALAIAAALPGGNPLAEALAAGETPSPELVAEAGGTDSMHPVLATICLAVILVGLGVITWMSPRVSIIGLVPLEKPSAVLVERAQEVLERVGYEAEANDTAFGYAMRQNLSRLIDKKQESPTRWSDLKKKTRNRGVYFWYRQYDGEFSPNHYFAPAVVRPGNPPVYLGGEAYVRLDGQGRLRMLRAHPDEFWIPRDEPVPPVTDPDWSVLFELAELDFSEFAETESRYLPRTPCDRRAAWLGVDPETPENEIVIEACAWRGDPVFFVINEHWDLERWEDRDESGRGTGPFGWVMFILLMILIVGSVVGAILLARRNLRLGRGDRRAARRVAFAVFYLGFFSSLFATHSFPSWSSLFFMVVSTAFVVFFAVATWLVYLALEPYLRKVWPEMLISWSRLLSGRLLDPLVGKSILAGALGAVAVLLFENLQILATSWLGLPEPRPRYISLDELRGVLMTVSSLLQTGIGVLAGLWYVLILVLLGFLSRRRWVGGLAFLVVVVFLASAGSIFYGVPWFLAVPTAILTGALVILVMIRFGILGFLTWGAVHGLLWSVPLLPDLASWHAFVTVIPLLAVVALSVYGFVASTRGRSLVPEIGETD